MSFAKTPECSVLIASSNAGFRLRIKQALKAMCVSHQAVDRADLERALSRHKPAILFLDLTLPNFRGMKGLPAIHRISPSTKIILLTANPNLTEELLALKAGVQGYCHRDVDPLLMKKAVQMVQKGELWVERSVVSHLVKLAFPVSMQEQYSSNNLKGLTNRQREIAMLVGAAASNKEIAIALRISESAVKSHLTAIFRKLGISARLALALMVKENPYLSSEKVTVSLFSDTTTVLEGIPKYDMPKSK